MSAKVKTVIRGVSYESRAEAAYRLGVTPNAITLAASENRLDTVGLLSPARRESNAAV